MTRQYFGTITTLNPSECFCFGSNELGFHGAGAAGLAMRNDSGNNWRADDKFLLAMKAPVGHPDRVGHWAVYGVGRGYQKGLNGESYAIATVTEPGKRRSISLDEIFAQMKELEKFATLHPEKTFFCAINGGGYNGYSVEEIRSLYNKWNPPENIHFPEVMRQEEVPVAKKYYSGIGSRQTPAPILEKMTQIAAALAKKGYTLRSGGAQGADRAFESGAVDKEVFRPEGAPNWAMKLVQRYVPASYKWNTFKLYTKQLQARNMQIILGEDGDSPVEFVICWTPDGKDSGGTGYGLRCAADKGIPVFNLKNEGVLEQFRWFYKNL